MVTVPIYVAILLVAQAAQFTPLAPLPAPEIEASAVAYPGNSFGAGHLIDAAGQEPVHAAQHRVLFMDHRRDLQ